MSSRLSYWRAVWFVSCCWVFPSFAINYITSPDESLQTALDRLRKGDRLTLKAGVYQGNFKINQPIHLNGDNAIIDANGSGSALTVTVAKVTISGLTLRNYGADSYELNSGILLLDHADDVMIENNQLSGPGFGIRGDNLKNVRIIGNKITGDKQLHKLDRGDGIYLKQVDDPYIADNQIKDVRDGVYLENVNRSVAVKNVFSHQQYGLHYMYTRDDEAWHNLAEHLDGGYALMSSERINLHNNISRNTLDFGILLNVTNDSQIAENQVFKSRNPNGEQALMTEGKGIFIYGAKDNQIRGNCFVNNDTGINMAMGGEGNQIWENLLINNSTQVKYVGDAQLEWSQNGRGNYWDNYQGWDFDQNGIGDIVHRPNDSLDKLFWIYPEAKLLSDSPVVSLLRWVERQFVPTGKTGVSDSFPLLLDKQHSLNKGQIAMQERVRS